MPAHITRLAKDARQKEILRLFDEACYGQSRWQTWADFVMMAAISISNAVDKSNAEAREKTYMSIASKYKPRALDNFAKMFAAIVETMDANPDQDCLGELYMGLELGNQKSGQFFTPYHVCQMMARMSNDDVKAKIEAQGWVSVNDCACGAGATLIAFANECRRPGVDINYQTSVLFIAQDIDLVTGCMCYIQLSLLGCPGYVVIGNTLTDPGLSLDGRGLIPVHGENIWYTPFYFTDIWHYRRQWWRISSLFRNPAADAPESTPAPAEQRKPEAPKFHKEKPKKGPAAPQEPQIIMAETENGQLMLF